METNFQQLAHALLESVRDEYLGPKRPGEPETGVRNNIGNAAVCLNAVIKHAPNPENTAYYFLGQLFGEKHSKDISSLQDLFQSSEAIRSCLLGLRWMVWNSFLRPMMNTAEYTAYLNPELLEEVDMTSNTVKEEAITPEISEEMAMTPEILKQTDDKHKYLTYPVKQYFLGNLTSNFETPIEQKRDNNFEPSVSERDRNKCRLTGYKRATLFKAPENDIRVYQNASHIIPLSIAGRPDVLGFIEMLTYDPNRGQYIKDNINDVKNGMTLELQAHKQFDALNWGVECTSNFGDNLMKYRAVGIKGGGSWMLLPKEMPIFETDTDEYQRPCPRLLEIHLAAGRILAETRGTGLS